MPEGRVGFVYHAEKPKFFAGILEIDYNKPIPVMHYSGANILFRYFRADGAERIFLIVVMDSFDKASNQLKVTLHNAASWYTACLNKEDSQKYGADSSWSPLIDYNVKTPGLQVLHIVKQNQYLVSYKQGIKSSHSTEAMDDFLDELGHTADKVGGGSLNTI